MKSTNLFIPALVLVNLLIPLAAGFMDIRFLFIIVLVLALVAHHFLGKQEFTQQCIEGVFYTASIILTLYFVDTAIAPDMFPFFDSLSDINGFSGMLALWVILQVIAHYTYEDEQRLEVVYLTAGIVAELTLAVNGQWGAQFFMLVLIAVAATVIMPFAEHMKRVLQLFFGAAFILSNMSLLFNYTEWLRVEGVTYSLETSVVFELVLSILALYVLQEWDRIPKDADIGKVRLCRLQRRIKRALRILVVVIAVIGLIGYDMGIGSSNTKIVFLGENGEGVQTGIFANTAVSLLYHVYGAFAEALSKNLIGVGFVAWGLVGAMLAILFLGICVWLLYRGYQERFEGKEQFAAIAIVELIQLIVLPVAWELLPMYALFLIGALRSYVPTKEDVKSFVKRFKVTTE